MFIFPHQIIKYIIMGQNKFPKTIYLDYFEIIDFIFKNEYGSYKGAFFSYGGFI